MLHRHHSVLLLGTLAHGRHTDKLYQQESITVYIYFMEGIYCRHLCVGLRADLQIKPSALYGTVSPSSMLNKECIVDLLIFVNKMSIDWPILVFCALHT